VNDILPKSDLPDEEVVVEKGKGLSKDKEKVDINKKEIGKTDKKNDKGSADDGVELEDSSSEEDDGEGDGEEPTERIIMVKEGVGRLYYRLGLKYIPNNLRFAAVAFGFSIKRFYEGVDNISDVWREDFKIEDKKNESNSVNISIDKEKDIEEEEEETRGIWHVKVGSRVRVMLRMYITDTRFHIALVDKLPAGFEALNPKLLGQLGYIPDRPKDAEPLWDETWVRHTNMRDERVEAFASYLTTGKRGFSYIARATTKGVFIVPPAKAEEMYSPELFGRTGTEIVIIED